MGRAVRRVPADWEHPRNERGHYIPMHTKFLYTDDEIKEGIEDGWLDADKPNYGIDLMPTWTPEEATQYQLYETTSEGTPISPIFDNLDDLCEWAAKHATTFASFKATADQWRSMLDQGWVRHQDGNVIFS